MNRRNFFSSLVGATLTGSFIDNFNKVTSAEMKYYNWQSKYKFGLRTMYSEDGRGYFMVNQSGGITKISEGDVPDAWKIAFKGLNFKERGSVEVDFTDTQSENYSAFLHSPPPSWAKYFKLVKTPNLINLKKI